MTGDSNDDGAGKRIGMSIEQDKKTAVEFLKASAAHDAAKVEAFLADDAIYWVGGKPHLFPAAGNQTKAQIVAYMATPSIFSEGLKLRVGEITAEGDRIAVEAESEGVTNKGRHYNNFYHYLFKFRDGRITLVKEYVDTQHAFETFCA